MVKSHFFRLFILICAASLLSGCGFARKAEENISTIATAPVTEPVVIQEAMPQAQLQDALLRAEYAMLSAMISVEEKFSSTGYNGSAYVGDVDGDNQPELAVAGMYMIFDSTNGRGFIYHTTPNYSSFYVDDDNSFYVASFLGDGFPETMGEGYYHCYKYEYNHFSTLRNGEWASAFSRYHDSVQEAWDSEGGNDYRYGEYLQKIEEYQIDGQLVSEEEYNSRTASLTNVTTKAQDYTVNIYDAKYTDSLLSALESRYMSDFGATTLRQDIDGDGQPETVIAVPGLLEPYRAARDPQKEDLFYFGSALDSTISSSRSHTGILVADTQNDKLILSAYCALSDLRLYEGMRTLSQDHCLWLDNTAIYTPGRFATLDGLTDADRDSVFRGLVSFLESGGYSDIVLKTVDIGDAPGSELLCLCRKDGAWYVLIFVFQDGVPVILNNTKLDTSAVYLTEADGQQSLLTYSQSVFTSANGITYTNYYYSVTRFDEAGKTVYICTDSAGFSDVAIDATDVAEFFAGLNTYMVKIIVISDPFQLQGNQWLLPEEAEYGTTPQEPEPEQAEEYAIGFVQIQNPSSWLNLREGPGTQYPCVLMDPSNPDSFVRQALGSPVTVLETIETGDAENPVWVKVRITYANKVIEGYSSKTYIRMADGS